MIMLNGLYKFIFTLNSNVLINLLCFSVKISYIMDKFNFLFNNLSDQKIEKSFSKVYNILERENISKIVYYLVVKRICVEPNFHKLYKKFLQYISYRFQKFYFYVFRASVEVLFFLTNKNLKIMSSSEYRILKYLGSWLGRITLKSNKPILNSYLTIDKLFLKSYDTGTIYILISFISEILQFLPKSRVFYFKNILIKYLLKILYEILNLISIKLNIKFVSSPLLRFIDKNFKLTLPSKITFNQIETLKINSNNVFQQIFLFEIKNSRNMNIIKKNAKYYINLIKNRSMIRYYLFTYPSWLESSHLFGKHDNKLFIVTGMFTKLWFFRRKIFPSITNYYTRMDFYFKNGLYQFWTSSIELLEDILNLQIECDHFRSCFLFKNFLIEDIKTSHDFVWFKINQKLFCSYLSFVYKTNTYMRIRYIHLLIFNRIEYFLKNNEEFKKEKNFQSLKNFSVISDDRCIIKGIDISHKFCIIRDRKKISEIFSSYFSKRFFIKTLISNKSKNNLFFDNLKIGKLINREILILKILSEAWISFYKTNPNFSIKIYRQIYDKIYNKKFHFQKTFRSFERFLALKKGILIIFCLIFSNEISTEMNFKQFRLINLRIFLSFMKFNFYYSLFPQTF
nr:hypothetical protein 1634Bnrm1_p027 [Cryptomonas sp.]